MIAYAVLLHRIEGNKSLLALLLQQMMCTYIR